MRELLQILAFALLATLVLHLAGCGHRDAYCDLPPPSVDSSEAAILYGEPAADLRGLVKLYTQRSWCSATQIGPHTVLTAAHCLENQPEDAPMAVWLQGEDRWIRPSIGFEIHPEWGTGREAVRYQIGDVAVVWFEEELPGPFPTLAEYPDGCYFPLTALGYGEDEHGTYHPLAREVVVYEEFHNQYYIYTTQGPCYGDSGSALYADTPTGYTILGVASFVKRDKCYDTGHLRGTAVYMNLHRYGQWVRERTY